MHDRPRRGLAKVVTSILARIHQSPSKDKRQLHVWPAAPNGNARSAPQKGAGWSEKVRIREAGCRHPGLLVRTQELLIRLRGNLNPVDDGVKPFLRQGMASFVAVVFDGVFDSQPGTCRACHPDDLISIL
jgi:hypothetical protein